MYDTHVGEPFFFFFSFYSFLRLLVSLWSCGSWERPRATLWDKSILETRNPDRNFFLFFSAWESEREGENDGGVRACANTHSAGSREGSRQEPPRHFTHVENVMKSEPLFLPSPPPPLFPHSPHPPPALQIWQWEDSRKRHKLWLVKLVVIVNSLAYCVVFTGEALLV